MQFFLWILVYCFLMSALVTIGHSIFGETIVVYEEEEDW